MLKRKRQCGSSSSQLIALPLFLKLPHEIRNMIYVIALGARRVHFMYWKNQLQHIVCPHPTAPNCGCVALKELLRILSSPETSGVTKKIAGNGPFHSQLAISLLSTCRQIHEEAVEVLYATNLWDVKTMPNLDGQIQPSILFCFTDIVQLKLIERIRRLEFGWFFKKLPGKSDMSEQNGITSSGSTCMAHWERINSKFPNLLELVLRIEVTEGLTWEVGAPMYCAAPMRKQSSNLSICKVFLKWKKKTWLLKELEEFMCSGPSNAELCIQKELVSV